MPGFVALPANQVVCSHGGQGKPAPLSPRVFIMGQPVVPLVAKYTIAGCSLAASGSSPPCATGAFLSGASRVLVSVAGALSPVVIVPARGQCAPTGQPLIAPPAGQQRVFAS
ncbi:hypothetical protein WOC76_19990 [Methylocystis sp. IM3]|jgi:hypothetical protein|uniref:hypothetical protein n=1 Tax=unclassified Methylocystis TaxID=2625913 RepID=UPI0026AA8A23